uniref:Alpha1 transcriptional factor n=1 Tax=Zygosaccharomyces rouxii TaxID=4956 RepID=L8B680_ZYGRO|nr:alpha1 transcriptional factor [Zygosaccharomyces rouxii]
MNTKSFRGFKSNQPLFKVKVEKKGRSKRPTLQDTTQTSKCIAGKCIEDQQVNVFMTVSKLIKIPSPPEVLLRKIEEEKHKLKKDDFNMDNILLWDPYVYWGEGYFFSIADSSLNNLSTKGSRKGCSEKPLNSFMAFRAYNSQFGNGLKQNILSSLLAAAWHSHPEQQKIWDTFAFNFVKPKCGFVEWVDQRYERESCI